MWNLLSLLGYKIPLITSITFRGDYPLQRAEGSLRIFTSHLFRKSRAISKRRELDMGSRYR